MILIAVDPGLASGFAVVRYTGAKLELLEHAELDWKATCRHTASWLMDEPGAQILVEAFVITPETAKKTPQPMPILVTGMLMLLAMQYRAPEPIKLKMSESKTFAPNARLKALGLDPGAKAGHARDAVRLAVLYAVRNGFTSPNMLL